MPVRVLLPKFISRASKEILMGDAGTAKSLKLQGYLGGDYTALEYRHTNDSRANVLLLDFHVETISPVQINIPTENKGAGFNID